MSSRYLWEKSSKTKPPKSHLICSKIFFFCLLDHELALFQRAHLVRSSSNKENQSEKQTCDSKISYLSFPSPFTCSPCRISLGSGEALEIIRFCENSIKRIQVSRLEHPNLYKYRWTKTIKRKQHKQ